MLHEEKETRWTTAHVIRNTVYLHSFIRVGLSTHMVGIQRTGFFYTLSAKCMRELKHAHTFHASAPTYMSILCTILSVRCLQPGRLME